MCQAVGVLVYWIVKAISFGMPLRINAENGFLVIASSYFKVRIWKYCSGIDGIFLLFFLLSVMLLIDWPLFRKRRWWALYLLGACYMFFFNALRIALLFLVGHWLASPEVTWLPSAYHTIALDLLHTNAGWILYLMAFAVFAHFVYRHYRRPLPNVPEPREHPN